MINIKYIIFTLWLVLPGKCAVGTSIRLVGDSTKKTGRVEMFVNAQWFMVDQGILTPGTAKVMCRMLGYGDSGIAVKLESSGDSGIFNAVSSSVINRYFHCTGNETDVYQCPYGAAPWSTTLVSNYHLPGAISCESTQLRLVDGDTASSGRVEVYIKEGWHTICDRYFDTEDARVICSMLGYADTGIALPFLSSTYGHGVGNPVLTGLRCAGYEKDIKLCGGIWSSDCNHRSDAGVRCGGTPIRLVNGNDANSGRVEIQHAGQWGTVCTGDGFDRLDAMVICRMLGYNNTYAFGHLSGFYGQGDGHVIASSLACDGTEDDIAQCAGVRWVSVSERELCGHDNDIGVNCNGRTHIRLADGFSEQSGRLEVFHEGHWGSVGSTFFDHHELRVVCRMLGHEYSEKSFFMDNGYFGSGSGKVVVDNLQCLGTERDIGFCQARWWPATSRMNHDNDVGISCDGDIPIRLVNGPSNATGRVELLHNGFYGTICDDYFGRDDLIVVCRMLGFNKIPPNAHWYSEAYHGQGFGEVLVTSLSCNGDESTLGNCGGTWWPATRNCDHSEDVSVSCDGNIPIRLVNGPNNATGRVELLHNGFYGTICDDYFGREDLTVVCRMLGFNKIPPSAHWYSNAYYGAGLGKILVTSLSCNGDESTLGNCGATWWPSTGNCDHSEDVSVSCDGNIPIRLVNGPNNATGRVELLHNGFYGTICDDDFGRGDLTVVCRMLGFNNIPPNAYWHSEAYYGEGLGEILVTSLSCNGDESTLGHCGGTWWPATANCHHSEDVSVSCDGTSETLRLVGGQNNHCGRVEILHNGQWGRMCSKEFDRADAVVLCRLLNFSHPETAVAYTRSRFGNGNGTVVVSNLRCNGLETVLEQCGPLWMPPSCDSYYGDVGVDCCPSCSAPQIIG